MIYLVIAVVFSSLVSIFMRLSEGKRKSSAGMFIVNYLMCMIMARIFANGSLIVKEEGISLALLLGGITGVLYLVNFVFLQTNIQKNGVVLASIFMKLGVIVPVLVAIVAFREMPKLIQIIGILLAVVAIIIFNYEKTQASSSKGNMLFLMLLLLGSGIADCMVNVYDKVGSATLHDQFLFFIFAAAFVCSLILFFVKKEKMGVWDLAFGALIGIPNYLASRFLLAAVSTVPAVVVYPVYSVGALVLISIVGVLLFHEKLSKQKLLGLVLVIASLVLLNL